jgi:hypothetical protein
MGFSVRCRACLSVIVALSASQYSRRHPYWQLGMLCTARLVADARVRAVDPVSNATRKGSPSIYTS